MTLKYTRSKVSHLVTYPLLPVLRVAVARRDRSRLLFLPCILHACTHVHTCTSVCMRAGTHATIKKNWQSIRRNRHVLNLWHHSESPNDYKAPCRGKNHIQTQQRVFKQKSTWTFKDTLWKNSRLPPPLALWHLHFPINLRWQDTRTKSPGSPGSTVCLHSCIYWVLTLSFTTFL